VNNNHRRILSTGFFLVNVLKKINLLDTLEQRFVLKITTLILLSSLYNNIHVIFLIEKLRNIQMRVLFFDTGTGTLFCGTRTNRSVEVRRGKNLHPQSVTGIASKTVTNRDRYLRNAPYPASCVTDS
jgi:hypothetical protein